MRWPRQAAVVAVAVSAMCLPAGCRGEPDVAGPRPIDRAGAEVLAGVLYENYLVGGADFRLTATLPATGDTIELDGTIDWGAHTGVATVTATGQESPLDQVAWNTETVYELVPALSDELARHGVVAPGWVARPPAPAARHLDGLLGLLIGLAAPQRDNPQLVAQEPSAQSLGAAEIDGVAVDGYTYQGSTYWVGEDRRLRRLETGTQDSRRTVVIDLTALGPRSVELPQPAHVASYADVAAPYDRAFGTNPG
ncbi:MAG TPA: hypothetical protein VNQ73_23325 [Ilumatobacter sp.]|nr:hypothetical protein [Ilumatobacter sp.]